MRLSVRRARTIREAIQDAQHPLLYWLPEPRWPYLYGIAYQRARYPEPKEKKMSNQRPPGFNPPKGSATPPPETHRLDGSPCWCEPEVIHVEGAGRRNSDGSWSPAAALRMPWWIRFEQWWRSR